MKDFKHIKSFNEASENSNISDVRSSKSHLDFLDEVVEKLNKLKEESHKRGYVDEKDVDFIEELYSTYSFFFDTEERFVK
jgi:hypothetical protein